MQVSNPTFGWNELDFLDAAEFRQMGPAIVGLEIQRLNQVLGGHVLPRDVEDCVRRALFELRCFVDEIPSYPTSVTADALRSRLTTSGLNLGLAMGRDGRVNESVTEVVRYVSDRLIYIHDRMGLLY